MVRFSAFLLAFAFLVTASFELQARAPMRLDVDPAPIVFRTDDGEVSFEVEVARTDEQRARGLMFREDLPRERGMLFVFEESRNVSFWMENTPLPLDLVFIDAQGIVRAILPGEPFSRASIAPGEAVRYVLELHRGTAAANGIEAGSVASHPAMDAAGQ